MTTRAAIYMAANKETGLSVDWTRKPVKRKHRKANLTNADADFRNKNNTFEQTNT
jgi:hypothetical protein